MPRHWNVYRKGWRKPADQRTQCVYVMESGIGACKVGRSRNPGERSKDISIGSPTGARLYYAICLRFQDACKLEKLVHGELKQMGRGASGEWFYISAEAVSGLIEATADRVGLPWVPDPVYGFGRSRIDTGGTNAVNVAPISKLAKRAFPR